MKAERIIWIIVILLIAGWVIHREITNNRQERGLQSMIEVLNDSIKYHQNERGEWEAERKSYNLTNKELRKYGQDMGIENGALRKRIGKLNNLVSHLEGELSSIGSGTVQLVPGDTIIINDSTKVFEGHRFDWTNSYLSLNGTLNSMYQLDFDYSYDVDFSVTTYWKREKAFKRKDLVVNMTFADPNARAIGLNSVVIKPDPPKFFETTWFKVGVGFLGGFVLRGL